MLGAYEPTIWNISWSEPTHIIAVLVSGYYRQAIAGLDPSIPILNSTSEDQGPCGYFYVGERENPDKLNQTSRRLFGRPVDLVYLAKNGQIVVGDAIPKGSTVVSSGSITPESFHDKTAPLAGDAALEDAVRKGLLRKATEADLDAWVDAVVSHTPPRDVPPIAGVGQPKPRRPMAYNAYVVLKPFTYPAGLNLANFLIPKGVPRPKGDSWGSNVYDFNTLKREGPVCDQ